MQNKNTINSDSYWDNRFAEDWESLQGPAQSRFFARLAIQNLPRWLIEQLQRQPLMLCDWGCAQGDGTDVWANYIDSQRITGIDFSSVAVEQAVKRYPAIRFVTEDWLAAQPDELSVFDVIFSSNTLEHFHKPYAVLETLCGRATKALVLALPYREIDRHREHFYTFLPDNIPSVIGGVFRLVWSRVVDCRQLPNTLWGGDQIVLIYAESSWVDSLGLTLHDFSIEKSDFSTETISLNQAVTERDGQIASLNQAVTERDGQIGCLDQVVVDRDEQIVSLNYSLTLAEAKNQELVASTSWRLTTPLRIFKRSFLILINEGHRYAVLKSLYWRLPENLRLLLNKKRHSYVASRIIALGKENSLALSSKPNDLAPNVLWVERANGAKKVAVIPCGFEFDDLVNQRPINASKFYSSNDFLVLYIAWQWSSDEVLTKGIGEVYSNIIQVPLYEFVKYSKQLSFAGKVSHYLITMPSRQFTNAVDKFRSQGSIIIYDIMDEWEEFQRVGQAPWYEKNIEHELVLKADIVSAVSPALREKFHHIRKDIVILGNGYSPKTLGWDRKSIAGSMVGDRILIGYFGHLTDAWFDWRLLLSLASRCNKYNFEIIGYGEPEWVRKKICHHDNITLIGKVMPDDLGSYVSRWSIGIIPFVNSTLSEAVDPIKIYEYLYFGLPVVVTGIKHLKAYPKTYYATSKTIQSAIAKALSDTSSTKDLDTFLRETTWDARFGALIGLCNERKGISSLYEH